jgi:excisionase family DNA binding protein
MYTYMSDDLLNKRQVAKQLRVHTQTVSRWARAGKIEFIIINNRGDRRFSQKNVDDYLESITHFEPTILK